MNSQRHGVSTIISVLIVVIIIIGAIAGYGWSLALVRSTTTVTTGNGSASSGTTVTSTVTVSQSKNPSPIVIGVATILSGPNAVYGTDQMDAINLAVNEINANGGVLGRPMQIVTEDDQAQPSVAVTAVQTLLTQYHPTAIIGGPFSGPALAEIPVVNGTVPFFITAATSPAVVNETGVGGCMNCFHISVTDASQAAAFAQFLPSKGLKSASIVAEDTAFGHGFVTSLQKAVSSSGLSILSVDFPQTSVTDFTNILTKIKSLNPQVILTAITSPTQMTDLIQQARQLGLSQLIDGRIDFTTLTSVIAGGLLNGSYAVAPYSSVWNEGINQEFVYNYNATYKSLPNYNSFQGYEAIRVIAQVIQMANSTNPSLIVSAAKSMTYWSILGVPLKFDSHNTLNNLVFFQEIQNDAVVLGGEVLT